MVRSARSEYKCRLCARCDGYGCRGQLPGMGGVFNSANFIANCLAWKKYVPQRHELPVVRLAPMTGAVENVGYPDEVSFYYRLIEAVSGTGVLLSVGDGCPDIKLQSGIAALRSFKKKAAVFIKPYVNKKIFERIEWGRDVAEFVGVDIDEYHIVTMRDKVQLEKKTPTHLRAVRRFAKLPIVVKGIFAPRDVELVRELKPDVAIVSNHGGRVETARGSTADFLFEYGGELARCAGEVWVDGGIRSYAHLCAARELGAQQVLIGRPFITALLKGGKGGVQLLVRNMTDRSVRCV